MPKPGHNVHIPLHTEDAIAALFRVKPDATMPRPGANPTGKPKAKKSPKTKRATK
jgi:hypothetical protein